MIFTEFKKLVQFFWLNTYYYLQFKCCSVYLLIFIFNFVFLKEVFVFQSWQFLVTEQKRRATSSPEITVVTTRGDCSVMFVKPTIPQVWRPEQTDVPTDHDAPLHPPFWTGALQLLRQIVSWCCGTHWGPSGPWPLTPYSQSRLFVWRWKSNIQ